MPAPLSIHILAPTFHVMQKLLHQSRCTPSPLCAGVVVPDVDRDRGCCIRGGQVCPAIETKVHACSMLEHLKIT